MPSRDFWIAISGGMIMASAAPGVSEWFGYHGAAIGLPWWLIVIAPIALSGVWIAVVHWFSQCLK